jgi:predicted HicB family RNase H-like nuclease
MNKRTKGRPPLDPDKVKNVKILVRLTKEDKKIIADKAKAEGKSFSNWVRERLLA